MYSKIYQNDLAHKQQPIYNFAIPQESFVVYKRVIADLHFAHNLNTNFNNNKNKGYRATVGKKKFYLVVIFHHANATNLACTKLRDKEFYLFPFILRSMIPQSIILSILFIVVILNIFQIFIGVVLNIYMLKSVSIHNK